MSPAELEGERPGSPGVRATCPVDAAGALEPEPGGCRLAKGSVLQLQRRAASPALRPTPTPPTARPAPRGEDAGTSRAEVALPLPNSPPPRRSLGAQTLLCIQEPSQAPGIQAPIQESKSHSSSARSRAPQKSPSVGSYYVLGDLLRSSTKDSPRGLVRPLASSHGVAVTAYSAFF